MLNRWTRLSLKARAVPQQIRRKATSTPTSETPKEPTTTKVWIADQVGMWPVIAITVATITYGIYQLNQSSTSPEYHFNREERKKMDYLENQRDPEKAVDWSTSPLQAGPDYIHRKMPYKRNSDYKP
jgi:hypothetical protein